MSFTVMTFQTQIFASDKAKMYASFFGDNCGLMQTISQNYYSPQQITKMIQTVFKSTLELTNDEFISIGFLLFDLNKNKNLAVILREMLKNHIISGDIDALFSILDELTTNNIIKNRDNYSSRFDFNSMYSWAIPSIESIDGIYSFLKDKGPVLEIASGFGLWAGLLQARGLEIIATDNFSSHGTKKSDTFIDVENICAINAVVKYQLPCLFICWPTYNDPIASSVIKAFKGKYLVYIGEWENGCNADDEFFEILNNSWENIDSSPIKNWWGIHDHINMFQRKLPKSIEITVDIITPLDDVEKWVVVSKKSRKSKNNTNK